MNINCSESGKTVTISLIGELDHHAAKSTMSTISGIIDTKLPSKCILDMSDITFMDSSGIAVMLNTYRRMNEIGGEISITNLSKQAGRVITASGIGRIVKIG